MCVIVHQAPGVPLTKELAQSLWKINPDGGGFAFINPTTGRIRSFRSLDWKQFWAVYNQDHKTHGDTQDFLLHFRIATHGSVCQANCHPFRIMADYDAFLFHNGVIGVAIDKDDDRSDSRVFAEDYLPTLPDNWLDNPWIFGLVEEYVGWSRIAVLTTNPTLKSHLYLFNEKDWVDHEGLKLSNGTGTKWSGKKTYGSWGTGTTGQHNYLDDEDEYTDWDWGRGSFHVGTDKQINFSLRRARLKEIRADKNLSKPIAFNPSSQKFECLGCDAEVGPEGECECLNSFCNDCNRIANECMCTRGFSTSLVPIHKIPDKGGTK